MLPAERKQKILAILKERREASVQGLAEQLATPPSAIRRDLRELESEERIERRHGRAMYRPHLVTPIAAVEEEDLEPALLDELVEETAAILDEARNLFLAGGALLAVVASKLTGKTIATHDLAIATAAAQGAGNDITLIGRELDNQTLTLRSSNFEHELQQFVFDAAVIEAAAIDDRNLWVARKNHGFLKPLLERSDSFVVIAKSTTLMRKGDRVAAPLARADLVVIDRGADQAARDAIAAASAELRIAGLGHDLAHGFDRVGNVFLIKQGGDRFGGRPADRDGTGE